MKKFLLLSSILGLALMGAGCSKSAPPTGPAKPVDPTHGHLIKGTSNTTVYYLGSDGKRYVFPNDKTYLSWFTTFSFVKQIADAELLKTPLGGNVTYKPGSRLIKIETAPNVYAITRGGIIRQLKTEDVAEQLYGKDWTKRVDDMPDAFFTNYKDGQPILSFNDFSPSAEEQNTTTIDQDKNLAPITNSTVN
jgi:hypothetical protein